MDAATTHARLASARVLLGRVGLRGRLLVAILVVALATLAVAGVGATRMSEVASSAQRVYSDGTRPLQEIQRLQVLWYSWQT